MRASSGERHGYVAAHCRRWHHELFDVVCSGLYGVPQAEHQHGNQERSQQSGDELEGRLHEC